MIPLCISCSASWDLASLALQTRASGISSLAKQRHLLQRCRQVRGPAQQPSDSDVMRGAAATSTSRGTSLISSSLKGKTQSKIKPTGTKPAIRIPDTDRKRTIPIAEKCTKSFTAWRDKG